MEFVLNKKLFFKTLGNIKSCKKLASCNVCLSGYRLSSLMLSMAFTLKCDLKGFGWWIYWISFFQFSTQCLWTCYHLWTRKPLSVTTCLWHVSGLLFRITLASNGTWQLRSTILIWINILETGHPSSYKVNLITPSTVSRYVCPRISYQYLHIFGDFVITDDSDFGTGWSTILNVQMGIFVTYSKQHLVTHKRCWIHFDM